MRLLLIMLVLVTILSTKAMTQEDDYNAGMCPTTPKLGDGPNKMYWFRGSIGEKPVRMYLEQGGDVVVGAFYYTASDWTPTIFGGHLTANGNLDVFEETDEVSEKTKDDETGRLTANWSGSKLTGQWIPKNQSTRLLVSLKAEPQPSCSGKEPWKRFDDGRLPATFSYPGSWKVGYGDGYWKLTCPDPSNMVYDYDIELSQGKERDLRNEYVFRTGTKWMHGPGCPYDMNTSTTCSEATATHRKGLTILEADAQEWRIYCHGGGYVGQGDGHERFLLVGDRWVRIRGEGEPSNIIGRIAATAKPRDEKR